MIATDEEIKFIRAIDCNFPYYDEQEWMMCIRVAVKLGPIAVSCVLEEIFNPGAGEKVTSVEQGVMFDYFLLKNPQCNNSVILELVNSFLWKKKISIKRGYELLNLMANNIFLNNYLNLLYYSIDSEDEVAEVKFEKYFSLIQEEPG